MFQEDVSQWRIIFLIAATIYIVAGAFYVCFASGEIQPWDSTESNKEGMVFLLLDYYLCIYSADI